jgi:hypothetical protein
MTDDPSSQPPLFVIGADFDDLIALPEGALLALASEWADWHAMRKVDTWGAFRAVVSPEGRERWEEAYLDGEEALPEDDEPFCAETDLPGFQDGCSIGWAKGMMSYLLPEEVRNEVGHGSCSMVSGDCWVVDSEDFDRLIASLERHGYAWRRDDDLVERATGFGEAALS